MDALITMTGWMGGDVDHRIHPNLTVATFRLACTPRIHRQGTWTDDPTTWLTVNCFRGLADNVRLSLHRGDPVIVTGRLRTQVWKSKEDGTDRERLVLEATAVGHDLNRGTATFAKAQRAGGVAPEPTGPMSGSDPWAGAPEEDDAIGDGLAEELEAELEAGLVDGLEAGVEAGALR